MAIVGFKSLGLGDYICIGCYTPLLKNRYLVVDKDGHTRSAFATVEAYFGQKIDARSVKNSWLCKSCLNLMNSWEQHRKECERIKSIITTDSIILKSSTSSTPSKSQSTPNSKKRTSSSRTPLQRQEKKHASFPTPPPISKARCRLNLSDDQPSISDCQPLCIDIENLELSAKTYPQQSTPNHSSAQQPPSLNVTRITPISSSFDHTSSTSLPSTSTATKAKSRQQHIEFYSSTIKEKLQPVIASLTRGSVRKAVRLLAADDSYSEQWMKGVLDILETECRLLKSIPELRTPTPESLLTFNVDNIVSKMEKNAPLLTSLITSLCKRPSLRQCQMKVFMCIAIILQERNFLVNSFQSVVSLVLHENCLQRDGFKFLQPLGLVIGTQTILNRLTAAKDEGLLYVKEMKRNIEVETKGIVHGDHEYCQVEKQHAQNNRDDHVYHAQSLPPASSSTQAFRFNIDNLDCEVKVRDMTVDHRNKFKNYVQAVVYVDRIGFEHLELHQAQGDLLQEPNTTFLPGMDDNLSLREDMIFVVSQVMIQQIPTFTQVFEGIIPDHFTHQYTENMKKASKVIPLGILDKNECHMNDMVDILGYLQTFVPGVEDVAARPNQHERVKSCPYIRPILVGGDQLTVERIRGAHLAMLDGNTPEQRLEGVRAMVEDFHEKINFMQVIIDRFYKSQSERESGTLAHLKCLINRTNFDTKASRSYHADAAFIDLVTDCHILTAAMEYFAMDDLGDKPKLLSPALEMSSSDMKRRFVHHHAANIVDKFIFNKLSKTLGNIEENILLDEIRPIPDGVYDYASNLLTFGLLRRISCLTTAAGDGDRCMRNWKFSFLVYHAANKYKYRLEAFLLLASVSTLLPARLAEQVKWGRFVNITGGEGKNVDGDYCMELLNNWAKKRIRLLGANHSAEAVDRIGKTLMFCHHIQRNLESQMRVTPVSRHHTKQSILRDREIILQELHHNQQVFTHQPGRQHDSFENMPADIFQGLNVTDLHRYILEKKRVYAGVKKAF